MRRLERWYDACRVIVSGLLLMIAFGCIAGTLTREKTLSEAERRIEQYRKGEIRLTLVDAEGKTLPAGTEVRIEQANHAFLFGCNIFMFSRCRTPKENELYQQRFKDLFNYATLDFYWGGYEPQQGKTRVGRQKELARWCRANSITTKGHPLFWTREPQWVGKLPEKEGQALLFGRIGREVKDFAVLVDIWDVVNEPGIKKGRERNAVALVQAYETLGIIGTIQKAFDVAKKANPQATLILNEYDLGTYEETITKSLKQGVPIDVIGIQSHMHSGVWWPKETWDVCERFARFGKPLHFTEVTILSGTGKWRAWTKTNPRDEKRQAKEIVEFYTILFSHPAVEAITWWDLSDQGAWEGAPVGLIREDMSPKPAYEQLRRLIKEKWWTKETVVTDSKGKAALRGFYGDYKLSTKIGNKTINKTFRLEKGVEEKRILLD